MTCTRCHRLVGITRDECFEPCVVTSVLSWLWEPCEWRGGKCSECKSATVLWALLIKDRSWFPQLLCVHTEANSGRGFPSWLLLHYFLWDFLSCIVVCAARPWLVVRQQWRQRKSCWRAATICGFYLAMMKEVHPRLPTALWLMMSCPSSVKISTFAVITECKWTSNALEMNCDTFQYQITLALYMKNPYSTGNTVIWEIIVVRVH